VHNSISKILFKKKCDDFFKYINYQYLHFFSSSKHFIKTKNKK
jgi:hypothetical protein